MTDEEFDVLGMLADVLIDAVDATLEDRKIAFVEP
jgi:hypothetical protein